MVLLFTAVELFREGFVPEVMPGNLLPVSDVIV